MEKRLTADQMAVEILIEGGPQMQNKLGRLAKLANQAAGFQCIECDSYNMEQGGGSSVLCLDCGWQTDGDDQ